MQITESLRRTILGIVAAILSALMFAGVLTPEDANAGNEAVAAILETGGGLITAFLALWGIFTKGNKD